MIANFEACYVRETMETLPELLAKVRLKRKGEVYLVVDVDASRETVELISVAAAREPHLIEDVPIAVIHELVEGPPEYI